MTSDTDWEARYRELRGALERYDRALRAYGLLGEAWVDHSEQLDELYGEVLRAADLEPPTPRPDDP